MKHKAAEEIRQKAIDYGITMVNFKRAGMSNESCVNEIRDKTVIELFELLADFAEALDLRVEDEDS